MNREFSFLETTISDVHRAFKEGNLTAQQLVSWYMDRIRTVDMEGPSLHAIVTVNERALLDAEALDSFFAETGKFKGPLHGIPVLVKDQAETAGIRTTFGTKAFANYVPDTDAIIIQRLKEAGAIILAKTSMCDFAAGWFSFSSMTDHTKNPYDVNRESGGSSAGTCAGVAANLGLVGIGEDTGGSIRLPASFNNLFGLRVTTGMISRTGLSPLVHFQDTPGPIARTVGDLAKLLDVLVGYDPADPFTSTALYAKDAGTYEANLKGLAVDQIRIGVLRTAFGTHHAESAAVNEVVDEAIERLKSAGATVVDGIEIPELTKWISETSLYSLQSKADIDRFMSARSTAEHHVFMDVYNRELYHPMNDLFHDIANAPERPEANADYYRRRLAQEEFRQVLTNVMGRHGVQALVFPDVEVLPPLRADLMDGKWETLTFPTNTVIASQSGLPALSIPAGFANGIPVGMELLGMPQAELILLQMAYQFEQMARPRKAPQLGSEAQ